LLTDRTKCWINMNIWNIRSSGT